MCNSKGASKASKHATENAAQQLRRYDDCSASDTTQHLDGRSLIRAANINVNDVLCGRGAGTNNHLGNRRFRQLVQACHEDYQNARIIDKKRIAECIVETVKRSVPSGRFLKRFEDSTQEAMWDEISHDNAIEKTSQALREQVPKLKTTKGRDIEGLAVAETANQLEDSSRGASIFVGQGQKAEMMGKGASFAVVSNHSSPKRHLDDSHDQQMGVPTMSTEGCLQLPPSIPILLPCGSEEQSIPSLTSKPEHQHFKKIITTVEIHDNDILCGRGGITNNHAGNIQFRQLVRSHQQAYLAAPKKGKAAIAQRIVDIVRHEWAPPGRFLIQNKQADTCMKWIEIGDAKAREKTSQALREKAPELRGVYSAAASLVESKAEWGAKRSRREANSTMQGTGLGVTAPCDFSGNRTVLATGIAAGLPVSLATNEVAKPYYSPQRNVSVVSPVHHAHLEVNPDLFAHGFPSPNSDPHSTSAACPVTVSLGAINENDVLYGRGAGINSHTGNKRFRTLVRNHQQAYLSAPKTKKSEIASMIVATIRNSDPPGRFLIRSTMSSDDGGIEEKWVDVGDEKAKEKTSQALREKASGRRTISHTRPS